MAALVRYVDTASAGGDGTTQSHAGGTAAFASLAAAEAALQQDLTDAGGDTLTIFCAGTNDDTAVTIAGWTTGAANQLTIAGDPTAPDGDGRNLGSAFNALFYHQRMTVNAAQLAPQEEFVILDGIQFLTNTINVISQCIRTTIGSSTNLFVVRNCRFENTSAPLAFSNVFYSNDGQTNVQWINCTMDWVPSGNGSNGIESGGVVTCTVFNCTMRGFDIAISNGSGTFSATNCAVFDNADDFSGTITLLNCAQDDNDAHTGRVDISPGTEATDWANAFTDYTIGDFRVNNTSSVLFNAGTNTGAPTTDIVGLSRPQGATVDIGAFELLSGDTLMGQAHF